MENTDRNSERYTGVSPGGLSPWTKLTILGVLVMAVFSSLISWRSFHITNQVLTDQIQNRLSSIADDAARQDQRHEWIASDTKLRELLQQARRRQLLIETAMILLSILAALMVIRKSSRLNGAINLTDEQVDDCDLASHGDSNHTCAIADPAIDWDVVLDAMGGNRKLLDDVAKAMALEIPTCLGQIDQAINQSDAVVLCRAAHTIKGSLRIFGPTAAGEIAGEIESQAKSGDCQGTENQIQRLKVEIQGFLHELNAFVSGIDPPAKTQAIADQPTVQQVDRPPVVSQSTLADCGEHFSILIIEDSDVDAMIVQDQLRADGRFKVSRVTRLDLGCTLLERGEVPDAVVLDLNLPDSAGLVTFKQIHRQFPNQPIVILTGESDESQAMEAMRTGAQDYVYKSSIDGSRLVRSLLYAIERNKRRIAEHRQRSVERDMQLAQQIQQHLLPSASPEIPGFEIAGRCVSADATSGDLFDFIDHGDGKWDIVLADVCGHGIGPAMITVGARRLLRSCATLHDDVGTLVTIANQGICDDTFGSLFVALFFARLDPATRVLTYVGAGQPAFLIDSTGQGSMLKSSGIPTGVDPDFSYSVDGKIELLTGQILLLMTDGVWEAYKDPDNQFGKERAFEIVHQSRKESAEEIVAHLIAAVQAHCHPQTPKDDVTVVVLKGT